jgi:6-phosphogluconolactonase (cycloisomerase 2 family)
MGTSLDRDRRWVRPVVRRSKRGAVAVAASVSALLIMAATALAVAGQLTQLSGTAGCVSENGNGGECADGKALVDPVSLATSADGKSVYVASLSNAVAVFRRNATGALTQLAGTAGCTSETGSGGICADGKALNGAISVTLSADGKSVYVASFLSDAVAVFARNTTTGKLTQLAGTAGCTSETGSGGACADGRKLDGSASVAVSADGKSVYVASFFSDAVAVFARNTTTGKLTQLAGTAGCVSETGSGGACADGKALNGANSVALSADGKNVYVASEVSDAVAVFARNTITGQLTQLSGTAGCVSQTGTGGDCADGKALDQANSVAVSADGKSIYVASGVSDAVAVFQRNTTTGALTQLAGTAGCTSEGGAAGCAFGKALNGSYSVAVSADGKSVYVASQFSDAVAVFARNTTTGNLTQLAGTAGCVSETGTGGACADGKALDGARAVAVSPDLESVYVGSAGSDAVVVFGRAF